MDKDARIIVVGGGAAGLGAAYYLEKAGFTRVTVLEKDAEVGGMCRDFRYRGDSFGMGAISITPDYHCVNELVSRFGLATMPCPPNRLMDSADGQSFPLIDLVRGASKLEVARAIAAYYFELTRVAGMLREPGFRHLDDELGLPFSSWLAKKGLSVLDPIFRAPITAFGYGRLEDIPTAYALKYMDYWNFGTLCYMSGADLLGIPPHEPKRLTNGLQALMTSVSGALQSVRTSTRIVRVSRDVDPLEVELDTGEVLRCEALVLALPLEAENLSFLDRSAEENRLFGKVFHNKYFTVTCEVRGLPYNVFFQLLEHGQMREPPVGFPILTARWRDDSDIATFYSVGGATTTAAVVEANVKTNVARLGREFVRTYETREWHYFSHVSGADLAAGYYDHLEALQGANRTYYAGKLMNFELVENGLAYSKALVERFFLG